MDRNGFDVSMGHIDYSKGNNNKTYYNTTDYWDSKTTLISRKGCYYIYTDYYTDDDGVVYPNIKVGDGVTLLSDLPFFATSNAELISHEEDSSVHITDDDRTRWDSSVTVSIDEDDAENLILTCVAEDDEDDSEEESS